MIQNPKKILIYSDLIHKKEWIMRMVRKLGLDAFDVENGADAVERTKIEVPDFVMLDVTMPKMGGIEVAAQMKELSSSVKIILISEVHSLSLQDSAKKARVDLFVIDSVAEVKVKEFIEAALSSKQLPPDISESIEREVLSRRGARRFPMEGEVQYQIGDSWWSGIFSNVSQDGLLFQVKEKISLGQKILLSWIDQGKKHIEIPAITVRRVQSDQEAYPYLVGVQFLKSSLVLNQKIIEMSDEEKHPSSQIDSELDLIQEALDQGTEYFKDLFQGIKASSFMESSISNIVDHERKSFQSSDEFSHCIQGLVTYKIITQLVENIVDQLDDAGESGDPQKSRVIHMAAQLLSKVQEIENNSDELVKKSIHENLNLQRHHLNESNNLLYQAQDSLLRSITNKIKKNIVSEDFHEEYERLHHKYKQLTSYQEHLEEIVRSEVAQAKKKSIVRTMKAAEETTPEQMAPVVKTKMILEFKNMAPTSILPVLALLLVFANILPWIGERMQVSFAKDDLTTLIKPRKVERFTQDRLVVDLPKQSWDELGSVGRERMLTQVEIYLTRKKLRQCKIMDGNVMIAAVFAPIDEDQAGFLHKIFVESPQLKSVNPVFPTTPAGPMRKSESGRAAVHLD